MLRCCTRGGVVLQRSSRSGSDVGSRGALHSSKTLLRSSQQQQQQQRSWSSGVEAQTKATSSQPLLSCTLPQLFAEKVKEFSHHDIYCFTHKGIRWTFDQLEMQSQAVGCGLAGLRPISFMQQEHITASMFPNVTEEVVTQIAAAKLNTPYASIDPQIEMPDLVTLCQKLNPRVLFFEPKDRDVEKMKEVFPEFIHHKAGVSLKYSNFPSLRAVFHTNPQIYLGTFRYLDVVQYKVVDDPIPAESAAISPKHTALIYTTVQSPNFATHSHENIANYAKFFGEKLGLNSSDRLAILYPPSTNFGHSIGLWACITYGAVAINPHFRQNPEKLLNLMSKESPTIILADTATFKLLLDYEQFNKYNFPTLKRGVIVDSLEKHNPELCERIQKGFKLEALYSIAPSEGILFDEATGHGSLLPHLEARITDGQNRVVSVNKKGTLQVKGYISGGNEDKNGWFTSGAQLLMDAKGNFLRK